MSRFFRVGSRKSLLALKQVEEIRQLFPSLEFEVIGIDTLGDKDKTTPISDVEGSDFFTREIDQALLESKIDLAIHSSKDLPDFLPNGLKVVFETESISRFDALVSRNNFKFKELPKGFRIGASSVRRKAQIKSLRPDLIVVDIRGTIQERLVLLDRREIDALIVAHAALLRLGLENRISEILAQDLFPAHPKQGSLSVVVREDLWEKARSILLEQALVTGS